MLDDQIRDVAHSRPTRALTSTSISRWHHPLRKRGRSRSRCTATPRHSVHRVEVRPPWDSTAWPSGHAHRRPQLVGLLAVVFPLQTDELMGNTCYRTQVDIDAEGPRWNAAWPCSASTVSCSFPRRLMDLTMDPFDGHMSLQLGLRRETTMMWHLAQHENEGQA